MHLITAAACLRNESMPVRRPEWDWATAMDLRHKRNDILRIAAQYGARNLRVFGSVARGDDRAHSDVDLLVDMDPDRSLLDLVGLGQDRGA